MSEASARPQSSRRRAVVNVLAVATAGIVLASVVFGPSDHVNGMAVVLGCAAVTAGWLVAGEKDGLAVSASFLVFVLAGAFLGPRSALVAALISELTASVRMRTRPRTMLLTNLPPALIPAASAAFLVSTLAPSRRTGIVFEGSVGLAALVAITLGFILFSVGHWALADGNRLFGRETFAEILPSIALNVLLTAAGAAIEDSMGLAGIGFALSAVTTFAYMAHLLDRARKRSQQYVALSWGVLAGLIRSLDVRDPRAGRHAAAVAAFSRDIAAAAGMSPADVELAHTAGLLHDIGHFALSDRVAERGRELTEDDWEAIHRHPAIGADLLKDLGVYGPVAEIVLAHHERIDGRGYPEGLSGDEIPEIAKVIAVAEVYDTLTAGDTYRTRMSSFEAIRELRRVAGSQLDARYVEVLTALLSGEGVGYRHADDASFDAELAIERRIRQAG